MGEEYIPGQGHLRDAPLKNVYPEFDILAGIRGIGTLIANAAKPKVKWYGPTMGKTTAAQTNSKLVDFDEYAKTAIRELADKKGMTVRQLKTESGQDYADLIKDLITKFRNDPTSKGKTLVLSNKIAADPKKLGVVYDNVPMLPSKEEFIRRNLQRGDGVGASEWYDAIMDYAPNLKVNNKYVSELEGGMFNYLNLFK